jgi:hypothetical protein
MSDREAARELLRELLHEALAGGNGQQASVPPPPVAAVLRPSTWDRPAAPGEVIGDGPPAPAADDRGPEIVALASDADLDRFVRALAARFEDPDERAAARSGRLRFTLGGATGGGAAARSGVMRVEHGAVTERTVKKAADAGARLVLGVGAVLTPLARDKARALGIEIERERRC